MDTKLNKKNDYFKLYFWVQYGTAIMHHNVFALREEADFTLIVLRIVILYLRFYIFS